MFSVFYTTIHLVFYRVMPLRNLSKCLRLIYVRAQVSLTYLFIRMFVLDTLLQHSREEAWPLPRKYSASGCINIVKKIPSISDILSDPVLLRISITYRSTNGSIMRKKIPRLYGTLTVQYWEEAMLLSGTRTLYYCGKSC